MLDISDLLVFFEILSHYPNVDNSLKKRGSQLKFSEKN